MPESEAKDVLSRAERIAREAHAGQKDWVNGEPYITHVERVVSMVSGEAAKSVAWLHDVLEDTAFERVNLVASSIPSNIIGAVEILTRVPPYDQHEHYDTYIGLIKYSGNTLATQVKLADLRDHLRPNCPERLRARYERAVKTLTDESDLRSQLTAALEAKRKAERELVMVNMGWAKCRDHLGQVQYMRDGAIVAKKESESERDEARATIQRLEADKREMREALERIGKRTCVGNCDQGNTCSVCIARAALSGSPAAEGTKCAMCGDTKRIKATDGIAEFMVPCPDCWRPKLRRAPQPSLLSQAVAAGEAKEGK